jgi:hypothetical protein
LRRDGEVAAGLSGLRSGARLPRAWRTPLYRSQRAAVETGVRSALCVALAALCFIMAGWSSTDRSLAIVAIIIGVGATMPEPRVFTIAALIALPMAVVLAGLLEFVVLDGVSDFPLLAIALAPFVVGATVLMTAPNQILSALGRMNLIYVLAILAPSNPQSYNPQDYVITSLLVSAAPAVLLAAQLLIPPVSSGRRQRWYIDSARHELDHASSRRDRRFSPEEAMFRDATRIAQLATAGEDGPERRVIVERALSYFDQAAAIRLCDEHLAQLAQAPLSHIALEGRRALAERDTQHMRVLSEDLQNTAVGEASAMSASGALALASAVLEADADVIERAT